MSIYAFDLLHLNGADLRALPLVERKKRLDELAELKPDVVPCLYLVQHFYDGERLLKLCKPYGLEGIVSKRRDRPYTSGESKDGVKVKRPDGEAQRRTLTIV
jgi:bifunctional non-homologous end joining protein LigD